MSLSGYEWMMAAVLVPAMLYASWSDFRRHRVPNWLNGSILLAGLVFQMSLAGWSGLATGMAGAGVGFALLFVFWMMRAMGAGDVKFMAAIGAWLGPAMTFQAVLAGGLIGGVLAAAMILHQRNWLQTYMNLGVVMRKVGSVKTAFGEYGSVRELSRGGSKMPYAIPLTIGTLFVLVSNFTGWGGLS